MKAKILLISTRWIYAPKSIFSSVERCNPSSALKEYFCAVSNSELRKLFASKRVSQDVTKEILVKEKSALLPLSEDKYVNIFEMLPAWLQNDPVLNDFYVNDDYSSFLNRISEEINSKSTNEDYIDQKDEFDKIIETISPYMENGQTNVKNEELLPFVFSKDQDDFSECLECNAINIDKDTSTGITLADRLSLYKVMEEMYEDKESKEQILFVIYAIWPLGNSNKDKTNDKEQDSVRWVDQLTKAIREECKENEEIELILLLHDNDMSSTVKTPLKTVEIDSNPSEVADRVKRTVAVYQHSNNKFIKLATFQNEKNAKVIYDSARNFIVDDLIFQQLTRLSGCLASYSRSEANECNEVIKTKIEWLKKYIKEEHDPRGYINKLDNLFTLCLDNSILSSQCLIDCNQSVNNLIKEIIIPEKYR